MAKYYIVATDRYLVTKAGISGLCGDHFKNEDDLLREADNLGVRPVIRVDNDGKRAVLREEHPVPSHVYDWLNDKIGWFPEDVISIWKMIQTHNWDVTATQVRSAIVKIRESRK